MLNTQRKTEECRMESWLTVFALEKVKNLKDGDSVAETRRNLGESHLVYF